MSRATPRVLFEDTHVLVIDKPAGLLSQGEHTGEPNLIDWARAHVGRHYVGLVHRLDRNTSGALVLAKRSKSADRLTRALQSGDLRRTYLAWLEGNLPAPVRWEHHLKKDETRNRTTVSRTGAGKPALLRARPLARGEWRGTALTLAEFALETGRSHQIRAQASFEGLPLLGDAKYGARHPFARHALHSYRISFPHPMSGEVLAFTAEIPADLAELGLRPPEE